MKSRKGFTLIEVIVVIAVVAILAAILTPIIAKNIDDAKNGRTLNECQVMASGITSFYKDTGRWPDSDNGSRSFLYVLETNQGISANGGGGNANPWVTWAVARRDTLDNQLQYNTPVDGGNYPSIGEFAWRGPYLITPKADPWGNKYYCNILASGWYISSNPASQYDVCFVISAGPNRTFNTGVRDDQVNYIESVFQENGDDIGFSLN